MDFNPANILNFDFVSLLPFNIAVIDKSYNVVWANNNFTDFFGTSEDRTCYSLCKRQKHPCSHCKIGEVFVHGNTSITFETGVDINGRPAHLAVFFIPIKNSEGIIEYVAEISTNQKELGQWQKEYNLLFERVPCYISIIDKDFNVIRANEKFRETYGDNRGKTCFELYKKKKSPCKNCPAVMSFEDGEEHISTQIGMTKSGEKSHYIVTSTPIARDDNGVSLVMEISTDITEITKLQDQLKNAHDFYATIIQNSADGIVALDNKGKTQIFNNAARQIFAWNDDRKPGIGVMQNTLPEEFFHEGDESGLILNPCEKEIINTANESIPIRFSAFELKDKKRTMGRVAFMLDMRPIRELETAKFISEKETAKKVFNSVENSLTLLMHNLGDDIQEFSSQADSNNYNVMYSALKHLDFKFNKTKDLAETFLKYSKDHEITSNNTDINTLVKTICDEYSSPVEYKNIEFECVCHSCDAQLNADFFSIKSAVDILMLNAVNFVSKRDINGYIRVSCSKEKDMAVIEVAHNGCGIAEEMFADKVRAKTLGLGTVETIARDHRGVVDVLIKEELCIYRIILPVIRA